MDLSSIFLLFLKSTWFYHLVFIEGDMCEQLLHIIVLSSLAMHSQLCHLSTYRAVVISETCIFVVNNFMSMLFTNSPESMPLFCPYPNLWCERMNMFNLPWCEAINFVLQQCHLASDFLEGIFYFVRSRLWPTITLLVSHYVI
jgi:hypothetical protein